MSRSWPQTDTRTVETAGITPGAIHSSEKLQHITTEPYEIITRDFDLIPIPKRLRYDPLKPFHFGIVLNVGFGFASTFSEYYPRTVAWYTVLMASCYSCREFILLSASVKLAPCLSVPKESSDVPSISQMKFNFQYLSMLRVVRSQGKCYASHLKIVSMPPSEYPLSFKLGKITYKLTHFRINPIK